MAATIFLDKVADIRGDFAKNPATDDLRMVTNEKAIFQHIDLLLMCDPNALIGRPNVCAGLRNYLFQNFGPHEQSKLRVRITETLKHEPRIKVSTIDLKQVEDELELRINFTFVDTGRSDTYRTTLRRVL